MSIREQLETSVPMISLFHIVCTSTEPYDFSSSEYQPANEYVIKTLFAKKSSPVTLILVYQTVNAQTENY